MVELTPEEAALFYKKELLSAKNEKVNLLKKIQIYQKMVLVYLILITILIVTIIAMYFQ